MTEPRIPNLFIIGAPKCGTTAMSHYLAGHPDIFMSEQAGVKEPAYFAPDLRWGQTQFENREDYLKLFQSAPEDTRYLGEATPRYLLSTVAVTRILDFSPDAKLIVMIRNPIDVAKSMHNHNVKRGYEPVPNFEKAWRLQGERKHGEKLPYWCREGWVFQYAERARLGRHLQRLFDTVSREKVHIIVYDDLRKDAAGIYEGVLDFLGLEMDSREQFPVVNPSIDYRWPAIERYLFNISVWRERLRLPGGLGLHKLISKFNTRAMVGGSADEISLQFRRELQGYFTAEIKLLSKLLDRDFSYWLA